MISRLIIWSITKVPRVHSVPILNHLHHLLSRHHILPYREYLTYKSKQHWKVCFMLTKSRTILFSCCFIRCCLVPHWWYCSDYRLPLSSAFLTYKITGILFIMSHVSNRLNICFLMPFVTEARIFSIWEESYRTRFGFYYLGTPQLNVYNQNM